MKKIFPFVLILAVALSACLPNPGSPSTPNTPSGTPSTDPQPGVVGSTLKFDYPNKGVNSGTGWYIDGLPTNVDKSTVLVAKGMFKNTIGKGSQSWLAEPGTLLVGPEFPQSKVDAAAGSIERISPITQELIDEPGSMFHLNEDRIDVCTFGSAGLEVNGVQMSFNYQEGHNYVLIGRGLFGDQKQDTDRNHTILFHQVVGAHAQCMSYPGNKGGFMSEGNFKQVVELSHKDAGNCGDAGCSKVTVVFFDLNTGALTVLNQANIGQPWVFEYSNWYQP